MRAFSKGYTRIDPDGVASLQLRPTSFEDHVAFGQCPCNLESQILEPFSREDSPRREIDISFAIWVVLVASTKDMGPYATVRDAEGRN